MPWKKGQSGNPAGPYVGRRFKLNQRFLKGMLDAYEKGGDEAIQRVMEEEPAKFVAICAALLPKHATLELGVTRTLADLITNGLDSTEATGQDSAVENESSPVHH